MAERRPTKEECYRQAYRYIAREFVRIARERAMQAVKEQTKHQEREGEGRAS